MHALVRRWLGSWRAVHIEVVSPLPADVARARLRDAKQSRWSGSADRQVVGRVSERSIRLAGRNGMVSNSWRPIAHCDLYPHGRGCVLTGTLRVSRPVLIFSAVWLGIAAAVAVLSLGALLVALATGHAREAGGPAAGAGVGAGFVLIGATIMGVGFAAGRRDGEFLLAWLKETLDAS
jgi:hypothetical protein